MVLESGIFLSQAIWLWRVRHVRREAKKAGKSYDEYVAEHPSKRLIRSKSSTSVEDVEAGLDKTNTSTSTSTNAALAESVVQCPEKSLQKPTEGIVANDADGCHEKRPQKGANGRRIENTVGTSDAME
jgi:hypothetical protein